MLKLNENYSDYVDMGDVNYPEGKAVNASSSESYDGTPLLASFMNDVNASHIAMFEKAYGNRNGISGEADSQKASQFADAVAKYTDDKVSDHAGKRGFADGVHGATSEASAGQIAARDENGNLKVGSAIDNYDAVNKDVLQRAIKAVTDELGSAAGKTAGSAAGNVPLVGSALGTTNNNILVTDASGGLKPSGTVIGSAAGKTAGSAAGNVPLVGTALGTTNNNILVTDASGGLKPSGTVIGSAAGKTAGSAAGNVPLVGSALGTTNNNILVTDASGGLKPSGTVIGSAAGKTAGSAAGNVPLVGTALGTTDNNLVGTNGSGGLKPLNMTPSQVAYWGNGGGICSSSEGTQAKVVAISGFILYTGVTVKILFTAGNSVANPTLNVNNTGAKPIKVIKSGGVKKAPDLKSGYWDLNTSGTATNKMWQSNTILELLYDGTDWIVMGNPILLENHNENGGYEVLANSKIKQQIILEESVLWSEINYNYYVNYADLNYIQTGAVYYKESPSNTACALKNISISSGQLKVTAERIYKAVVTLIGY